MADLISSLNKQFGKDSHVEIIAGEGGLTKVHLKHSNGSVADIYLNGGHVSNWTNSKGEQIIFMSSKAIFKDGKAIRGGVPICWPQFGPGELPQHGFARSTLWSIKETHVDKDVTLTLSLSDSDDSRKIWNHHFLVEYKITLHENSISFEFKVTNKNTDKNFTFTSALHTYFKISDINKVQIVGLKGLTYIDKVQKAQKFEQKNELLHFSGETDSVYLNTPNEIKIIDSVSGSTVLLKKDGFEDCVVWNPWADKCKEMADMGIDDWKTMVCAEAARVGNPITLHPGETWIGHQELSKL